MDSDLLNAAVPIDRLHALASGVPLPEQVAGAALFADVAGFTALARRLAAAVGPRRGAEELALLLNSVYNLLVARVHSYGGSIVGFSGDAINCWFDQGGESAPGPPALARALTCALRLQEAVAELAGAATVAGPADLGLKVAVSAGPARRLLLGDPRIQLIEVLAGATVNRVVAAAGLAVRGEVVADPATADLAPGLLAPGERRQSHGDAAVVVTSLLAPTEPCPWPALAPGSLRPEDLRPWLPGAHGAGLAAGLRPAVALMLRFALDDLERPGAVAWLNTLVGRVQAIAREYEGTLIDVTMGDHGNFLYVAFGAPVAHDDDSARAVACALALKALEVELGARLWIGLAAGTVRVGFYGGAARRTYGVIGEPPTLACRLMDAAPPGAIWCDGGVARLARRAWAFAALPPIMVKGRSTPVAVFQPTGAPAQPAPAHGLLLGREQEADLLREACAALARARGQTLVISGEAGIGKTRLTLELRRLLAEGGLDGLCGAGVSIEEASLYRGWREVFAALLGLDGARDAAARAAARAAELAPAQLERLPLLNDVLGLGLPESELSRGLDAQLRRENLAQLLLALIRASAVAHPLAVLIEDGHWLDSLSWSLACDLARAIGDEELPILLVLTTRPIDAEHRSIAALRALLGLPATRRLVLQPLPVEQTVALIAGRLGVDPAALPAPLVRLVGERGGGNPLFAEELVADLRERGALRVGPGPDGAGQIVELTVALDGDSAGLPDTLEALLLARIDRLAPDEQLTIRLAAVIGPTFAYAPLRHLRERHAPLDEGALRNQLRGLAARELTALEAPDPRLAYSFRHVLTHAAAYGSLLYAQRRQFHRSVAEWHEAAGEEPTAYSLLAYHYRHAEEPGRERHYARLAAVGAADRYANAEAVAFYSRALALTPAGEPQARFELLLARERLYELIADHPARAADLAELAELAEALDDPSRRALVRLRRGQLADATGDSAAQPLLEEAIALARACAARRVEAEALQALGLVHSKYYDLARGQARLEQALAVCRAAGLEDLEAEVLRLLGINASYRQDYQTGLAWYGQALGRYRAAGNRRGEGLTLLQIGVVQSEQEDEAAARVSWEASLAILREIGDALGEAIVVGNMGFLLWGESRLSEAMRSFEQAERFYRRVGDAWNLALVLANIGNLYLFLGAYAQAESRYAESLRLRRELGDREGELWALHGQAQLLIELGRPDEAAALLELAPAIARELETPMVEAMTLLHRGRALLEGGRHNEAVGTFRESLAIYRRLEHETPVAEILVYLAKLAWLRGDLEEALGQIEAGLPQFLDRPLAESSLLFDAVLACWQILHAAGDPRAAQLLAQARGALAAYAAGIDEPELRESFLNHVPAHRALRALTTDP